MTDKPLAWPPQTKEIVDRIEAKIRARLAAMSPAEQAAFWAALPYPLNGAPREPGDIKLCAECGGWFRRDGDLCGRCAE